MGAGDAAAPAHPCPHPAPALPPHWTWQACTGLRQSPLDLETDLLRLWRNESGFPLLTSLLIRFRQQRAGLTGCTVRGSFPWAQVSLRLQCSLAFSESGGASDLPSGARQESRGTRVSTHPPSCWCLCVCVSVCECVCAGFQRSLQTKPAGGPFHPAALSLSPSASLGGTVDLATESHLRWGSGASAGGGVSCWNPVPCLGLGLQER